jgi:hypothetical protein
MPKNKKGPSTVTKKGWTAAEVDALKKQFDSYIKKKNYPSGQQIKDFLQKKNINRTVIVVKSKLQHLIKLANRN